MDRVKVTGIADDGLSLLLSDGEHQWELPINDKLINTIRRAIPAPTEPAGMNATDLPRIGASQVQEMLRTGIDISVVSQRSGWSIDKVLAFEGPIRGERDYIANMAKKVVLYPQYSRVTLEESVQQRLRTRQAQKNHVWDAWKISGTTWLIQVVFLVDAQEKTAQWHFDRKKRLLTPRDDEARWLAVEKDEVAEQQQGVSQLFDQARALQSADISASARTARGNQAAQAAQKAAQDYPHREEANRQQATDNAEQLAQQMRRTRKQQDVTDSVGAAFTTESTSSPADSSATNDADSQAPDDVLFTVEGDSAEPPSPSKPKRRTERPIMPTWDDIMFGTRSPRE